MQHHGEALRVILVGHDLITLAALRERVRSASDLEIAAEAWSLDRASGIFADVEPDVAVVDVSALGEEGIEQIHQLRSAFPDVHIVAVSSVVDSSFAERIIRAGALGYVVTSGGLESLPEAIRSVVHEKAYVSRSIARRILTRMIQGPGEDLSANLSQREREVFELLGSTDVEQIAERLGVTRRTVMGYCARIRSKLNVSSSSELIAFARRWHSEHAER